MTCEPVYCAGAGRSTYSGRAMLAGTGRRGEIVPGSSVPSGAVEVPVLMGGESRSGSRGPRALPGATAGATRQDACMSTQWFYDTSTGQVQELEHKGSRRTCWAPTPRARSRAGLERAKARTEENDRRDREEDDW